MSHEIEQAVARVLEQSFDLVDYGKPKREWQKWLEQMRVPPQPDDRGGWLRKKTLEQHGLDHGYLFHFSQPATNYLPSYEVFVAFDTFSLDVIWVEGSDETETVYFSKYDYADIQENFSEEYERGDLRELALIVSAEQDIFAEYEEEANELLNDPLEYVPHTDKLVEI